MKEESEEWVTGRGLKSHGAALSSLRALADLSAIFGSAALSYLFAREGYALFGSDYSDISKVISERSVSFPAVALVLLSWLYLGAHHHGRMPFWEEAREVMSACAFSLLAEGFFLFAAKSDVSRLATVATWLLAPFLIMSARLVLTAAFRSAGVGVTKAAIVGRTREAEAAKNMILSDSYLCYACVGSLEPGPLDVMSAEVGRMNADIVVIALSGDDSQEAAIAARLRQDGYQVALVPSVPGFTPSGVRMQYVMGQDSVLFIDKVDVLPRLSRLSKRIFDIVVSFLAITLTSVPMLAVALMVKFDGGPAIFAHERVGRGGRRFRCLKFRSMAADSSALLEEHLENNIMARKEWLATRKLKDDPRVTLLGKFIRKTALDELPQLFNVLRGDMSLVGPRPVTSEELDRYGAAADLYLSVRPGMTGLWQVSGRNDLSYEQRVGLDAWYVNNWSPWHDTAIILKTFPALIFRRGAY